jgi:hypothetical protein
VRPLSPCGHGEPADATGSFLSGTGDMATSAVHGSIKECLAFSFDIELTNEQT